MTVKLLTEHNLEFLSLKVGYTGWSESTHVKIPYCWKSHDTAQLFNKEGTTGPPIPFYSTCMELILMGSFEIKQRRIDVNMTS